MKKPILDLAGTWQFCHLPRMGFANIPDAPSSKQWSDIQVPGQWRQQGFQGRMNQVAGVYQRTFLIPEDWAKTRIVLHCEAIYDDATVWVNGKNVGRHLGGFTPFEIDITSAVQAGKSATITIAVTCVGSFDCGVGYAAHNLGGITRKIQLVALPAVNLSSMHILTHFDSEFKDATLEITARVVNDGALASPNGRLTFALRDPQGNPVVLTPAGITISPIKPGKAVEKKISIPITRPQQWDVEHPRLYTLTSSLNHGGTLEKVSSRVGFRQVNIRGSQLFLNGHTLKLRGVCRHETDPLRGRSLTNDEWRQDAELFARANINFVRTSHYPPAKEFLDACDEIGILVESEGPFCWCHVGPDATPLVILQTIEMVEFNRNHPSVIIWSLANESEWSTVFDTAAHMLGLLDPSRPCIFSFGEVNLKSWHYPSRGNVATDRSTKPVLLDEYFALNCFNKSVQYADPGIRDIWGI